jgi:hypothetical protein
MRKFNPYNLLIKIGLKGGRIIKIITHQIKFLSND